MVEFSTIGPSTNGRWRELEKMGEGMCCQCSFSIPINASPKGYIKNFKGVRQGDLGVKSWTSRENDRDLNRK